LAFLLTLAKVGKRGGLVIPSEERRKARIEDGTKWTFKRRGAVPQL
jgi:bifunctional DNA-binding transcriptional regulator/antitoxin component of YhaV-PrlF toxin-antitoxin module